MFDSTRIVASGRWGYVSREEGCDYNYRHDVPLSVKLNPLRYEIGIGSGRPCGIRLNKGHRAWLILAKALYSLKHKDTQS